MSKLLEMARADYAERAARELVAEEKAERVRRQRAQDALLAELTDAGLLDVLGENEQPTGGVLYAGPVALVMEFGFHSSHLFAYARRKSDGGLFRRAVSTIGDIGELLVSLQQSDEQGDISLPDALKYVGHWDEPIDTLAKRIPLPEDAKRPRHITDPLPPCPKCQGNNTFCDVCEGKRFDPEAGYTPLSAVATHVTVYAPGEEPVRRAVDDPDADKLQSDRWAGDYHGGLAPDAFGMGGAAEYYGTGGRR